MVRAATRTLARAHVSEPPPRLGRRTELRSRLWSTGTLRPQLVELDAQAGLSDAAQRYDNFLSTLAEGAGTSTRRELAFSAAPSPV